MNPDNLQRLIKAIVILHNMLQRSTPFTIPPNDSDEGDETAGDETAANFQTLQADPQGRGINRPRTAAIQLRDTLKDYFTSEFGAVEWQNRAVMEG